MVSHGHLPMRVPTISSTARTILACGIAGGVLIAALRFGEYRLLVLSHSAEMYAALVAALFSVLGIVLGAHLTRSRPPAPEPAGSPVPAPLAQLAATPVPLELLPAPFVPDPVRRAALGLTPRELEILGLVAEGLSNREIAGKLFVSENTVKTHCSRAFDKLGARRRTQAVQLGKEHGLLP